MYGAYKLVKTLYKVERRGILGFWSNAFDEPYVFDTPQEAEVYFDALAEVQNHRPKVIKTITVEDTK